MKGVGSVPLQSVDGSALKTTNKDMFQVNNWNSRKRCETCGKLTIKTTKLHHWRHSGVFIVNFVQYFTSFSSFFYCWLFAGKYLLCKLCSTLSNWLQQQFYCYIEVGYWRNCLWFWWEILSAQGFHWLLT